MKKLHEQDNVKMNLTLTREFYELLQGKAKGDFVRVATWTKQFLMKHLLEQHNTELKTSNQNEHKMEN